MNTRENRRKNLRIMARALGGISELAKVLNRGQAQLSHLIGKNPQKNVGDRLASIIETTLNQPPGWLDIDHSSDIDFAQIVAKIIISPSNIAKPPAKKQVIKNLKTSLIDNIEKNFASSAEAIFKSGKTAGIQQGKEESLREIALRLLAQQKQPEFIADITGLSLKQIKQLRYKIPDYQK